MANHKNTWEQAKAAATKQTYMSQRIKYDFRIAVINLMIALIVAIIKVTFVVAKVIITATVKFGYFAIMGCIELVAKFIKNIKQSS